MDEDEQRKTKRLPENFLEYNQGLIDTAWGTDVISQESHEGLIRTSIAKDESGNVQTDEEGNVFVNKEDLWGKTGIFTRDFRLSNLNKDDYKVCVWWSQQASAAHLFDFKRSAAYCLLTIAPVLELSQSKNGFLREQLNTLTNVNKSTLSDGTEKKSVFSFGKKQ